MDAYVRRIADGQLAAALDTFGAVAIEGPKWCGKTTTARQAARSELLIASPLNDFANRSLAQIDPSQALRGAEPRLVDEWQEVPKLWDAARFECDTRPGTGHFIFTGSATPNDSNRPTHSGAGRFAHVRMGTMTLAELGISSGQASVAKLLEGTPVDCGLGSLGLASIAELVVRGGWPGALGVETGQAQAVAREYLAIIAETDVSAIDGVSRDPNRVTALLRSLARNEATLASARTIAADLNGTLSRPTLAAYIDVLRRLHVIDDIDAWNPATRSPVRLREAKKHHFADVSLAAAALGLDADALLADVKTLGLLFESLALHDLGVYARACGAALSHYHDYNGLEADAIVSKPDGTWAAFEVKLGAAQADGAAAALRKVAARMRQAGEAAPAALCVIIGFGLPAHVREDGVQVIPIDCLGP